MIESFEMNAFYPEITAKRPDRAWLDSEEHVAMTGSPALVEPGAPEASHRQGWLHFRDY